MVVDVRCGSGDGEREGGPTCDAMEVALCQKAQVDWQTSRWAAEFETSGAWQESGAVSARAWMVHRCRISRTEAGRFLRWGRALRDLPLIDLAFSEGRITGDHVDLLVRLDHGVTKDALHDQEQELLDMALGQSFDPFKRAVARWRQENDPDGTTEEAEERRNRRDVQLSESLDGMWFGRMLLDPVSGAIVKKELDRLVELLFWDDWAEATERLTRTPLITELRRTLAQRRADAMVMMAARSACRSKGSQKPSPLFTVHMDWDTMQRALSELEDGTPLPPNELLSWLEGADIVRFTQPPEGPATVSYATKVKEITLPCIEKIINDTPNRQECPPTDRVFTGATRRAIEIRDRECSHPYCDRPARWCQIDHITPWSQGGLTVQENGRLLCGFHNRWYYQREQRPGAPGRTDPETRPPPRRE